MTRTSLKGKNCSVAQFAEVFGDKWVLLIMREAFVGVNTFSEFEKRVGAAKNVLTERLNHLVKEGILDRHQVRPGVERYKYELTAKGKALFPALTAMQQWSDKWVFGTQGEPWLMIDKQSGARVQAVEVIARDGRMLGSDDVEYSPGPGRRVS